MKSRLDILKQLDIKCGQITDVAVYSNTQKAKTKLKMVCGVHFCLATVLYALIARSPVTGHEVPIKKLIYNNNGLGSYSFEYETLDGSYRKEDGGIIPNDSNTSGLTVKGEYGFIDPDGFPHYVRYVADINGFRPRLSNDDIRYNDRRIV